MRTSKLLLRGTAVVVLFALLNGCKKDDEKSKTQLLTEKPWFVSKAEEKAGTANWVDDFPNYAACEKDDATLFKSNGQYENNEGATKCSAADPQIISTGTWNFASNETVLNITESGSTLPFTIEQLNENNLVVSYVVGSGAAQFGIRYTFRH
jgi:hypothetical protein